MTGLSTGQVTAPAPAGTGTRAGRLGLVLAGLLAANLVLYAIGRALGGTFTYAQNGAAVRVDPAAITIMSLGPLAVGLALVAALSRGWPVVIRVARIAAPALALLTIVVMTIPAGFDTTSAVFLAAMHLATIPAALLALGAITRRDTR